LMLLFFSLLLSMALHLLSALPSTFHTNLSFNRCTSSPHYLAKLQILLWREKMMACPAK
jgi:hypothetical protein